MLIERMQTNPEDFGYGGRLYHMYENKKVSARDGEALYKAHDKYVLEPRLMVQVLETLLAQPEQPEEDEKMKLKPQGRYTFGFEDPKLLYGSPIQNELTTQQRITREMYEDHIKTHKNALTAKPSPSILSNMYNKALGRERIERDN
jgi:hypothetical protein